MEKKYIGIWLTQPNKYYHKLLLSMKITILLLLTCVMNTIANNSYSQTAKVTLNLKNTRVEEVLNAIETNSEYYFLLNQKKVNINRRVDVVVKNSSIKDVLNNIFKNENISYVVYDRQIILTPKENTFLIELQQHKITGTITDANTGETIIGANIRVEGTSIVTVTDVKGSFSLNIPKSDVVLLVTYMGYNSQRISMNGQKVLNIMLIPDITNLNEVVVIGYGTVRKSDLTGAVGSVTEKDFNKGISTNANQIIQGRSPGVTIMQANAQPGGASRIQIRGITSINASNEPLYVVDGMPIDNSVLNSNTNGVFSPPPPNPLNTINPADIASVEILKDASATAIYGSRGANGVVLITTKKGGKGKMTVGYDGSIGFQSIAKQYDLPDAYQYSNTYNKYYDFYKTINPTDPIFNNAVVHKFSENNIAAYQNDKGTDWFNALTRQGQISNHQLSISGGTDNSTYYASMGYLNHKGVISFSDLERISGRVNVTQKIGKIFEFGVNISVSTSKTSNVPTGTNDVGDSRGGATSGAMYWAPTIPGYASDGTINVHPYVSQNSNPYGLKLVDNKTEQNRTLTTSYLQMNFNKNFFAKVTGGYDKASDNNRSFVPAEAKNSLATQGEATQGNYVRSTNLLNFILQYTGEYKKHRINLTGGTDYQTFKNESLMAKALGFSTSAFSYNNMNAATTQNTYSGKTTSTILSYIGRANYIFNDKYLLTGSFRYDGSSKFADGLKWGFFPSGAIAWKMGKENFIKDLNVFSDLKLRFSYGKTGNQSIGTNNSQPLLGSTMVGTLGNVKVNPIGPTSPGNKTLTWETTTQQDIGLDFGFFGNRVTGTIDYYKTVTTDLLLWFKIPSTSGFSGMMKNAGAIQNNGLELSLTSQNLNGKLEWTTSFNIAFNKNRWKDRAGLPYVPEDEFGPVYGIYGYIVDGIWQQGDNIAGSSQPLSSPGQFKFRDINGSNTKGQIVVGADSLLNSYDRVLLGSTFPTTTLGLTNNFAYKDLTLSFFIQGMFGFKIYNQAKAYFENPYNLLQLSGVDRQTMNFWNPGNTNTMVPSGKANSYGSNVNSVYVENGNFIRLKNINLSYRLPFKATWFQSANIYINIDNLLLITKYSGLDPESANPMNNKSGSENDVYPNARTYSLGFNFNF